LKILNLEPKDYSSKAINLLNEVGYVISFNGLDHDMYDKIGTSDVIITRLKYQINKNFIDRSPNLKYILTATTGLDHIDLEYAKKKTIKVISLNGETKFLSDIHATAEHTWAILMSLIRNLNNAYNDVKNGNWNRDDFKGQELNNKVLGVMGGGRIGQKIFRYAKAFNMKVICYDPHVDNFPDYVKKVNNFQDFLKASQILTLHIPLNKRTKNIIGYDELRLLPKGGILINTSRGGVIDEDALVQIMLEKHLFGCALDVVKDERVHEVRKISKLFDYQKKFDNILITPHIAGATKESMEKTEIFIVNKFLKDLRA
tara:strand:+ start:8460 stop:9404 length:945 start_codon:yes stop_codon:yes gene_type:complete